MRNFKYIIIVFIGASLYGTMSSFVKLFYGRGYGAAEIAFFQAAFAAIMLSACALWRVFMCGKSGKPSVRAGAAVVFSGAAIGLTNYFYYQSVAYIQASLAVVLLMQFTWIGILLEWLGFGRRPNAAECVTVLFVLAGTCLAGGFAEEGLGTLSVKGLAYAVASAVTYAVYVVANAHVASGYDWSVKSALIMAGASAAILSVNCGTLFSPSAFGADFFLWAFGFAVFGTTLPTALFAAGIPKIGAGISAIIMTAELPMAVLCAHAVLGEDISALQGVGILIMLCSIAFINYYRANGHGA